MPIAPWPAPINGPCDDFFPCARTPGLPRHGRATACERMPWTVPTALKPARHNATLSASRQLRPHPEEHRESDASRRMAARCSLVAILRDAAKSAAPQDEGCYV